MGSKELIVIYMWLGIFIGILGVVLGSIPLSLMGIIFTINSYPRRL